MNSPLSPEKVFFELDPIRVPMTYSRHRDTVGFFLSAEYTYHQGEPSAS